MAIYVVGDIQGCFECLEKLLEQLRFDPNRDELWAAGDLVNRGPDSLKTLRFCMALGESFKTVLGNHDLHLLAVARGHRAPNNKDTLQDVLSAPDRKQILDWLQSQPLMLRYRSTALVHAGIPPQWSIVEAEGYAGEVAGALSSQATAQAFFAHMYGNEPLQWRDDLEGVDRLRCITNYFTRMRYCDGDGKLNLSNKQAPHLGPEGYSPWFAHSHRKTRDDKILFGHWASLNGKTGTDRAIALDTGCVWGGSLTAMELNSGHRFTHSCSKA